jgi:hypothetical protein
VLMLLKVRDRSGCVYLPACERCAA